MKKFLLAILIFSLLAFLSCGAPVEPEATEESAGEAEEEPEEYVYAAYRANNQRAGVFESEGPRSLAGEKWKANIGRITHSAPVIYESILYIGTADTRSENHLYALDTATGEEIWKFEVEGQVVASAAAEGGMVYIGDTEGNFYALDSREGNLAWDFKVDDGINSSAAVENGAVYFGGGDFDAQEDTEIGAIFALDARSGEELWRFNAEGLGVEAYYTVESTPAVSDNILYYRTGRNALVALDMGDQSQKWTAKIGGMSLPAGLPPSPAVYKDMVFCGSMDRSLHALGLQDGEVIWSFDTGDYVHSSPAFYGDLALIGGWSEIMFAVDINDGTEAWRFEVEGNWIISPPSVAGDTVYFGADDGKLYALDAATGQKLWEFETGRKIGASPAIAQGVVYAGSEDGYVYALH
ncbi:MAG: PQQ-binding-like beta-propeller repeat protein [Actinomycetota bacterium]